MFKRPMTHMLYPLLVTVAMWLFAAASFAGDISRFTTSDPNGLQAELVYDAAPLRTMKQTPFTLSIRDAHGETIRGLSLQCDMTMPAMPMPINRPKVEANSEHYTGHAVFTMAGAWQATFSGCDSGGQKITLIFDIPKVLLK
ncbi:MAG: hypothetical protein C0624_10565 [Desulfuromonas sp.]|nr:MAG: hypothetical protein C0624_10565 [Desulfuromonas sp.]